MSEVTVDFVAFDESGSDVVLVFVEQGWEGDIDEHLRSLQDRFYTAIEAALDGNLAKKYPQSVGCRLVLRVDCYDLPYREIDEFAERFERGVKAIPGFSTTNSQYIRDFKIEIYHDTLPTTH